MKKLFAFLLLLCACATAPAELTLDQKIGQLFVYAANGDFMNRESAEWRKLERLVTEDGIGGVHWYAADVLETAWMTSELQRMAGVPLLVSADLESGIGMRFADATHWPWAMALAATGDTGLAERAGRVVAREALAVGINQIYAPVADVNNNPDNPVINVRSFGEDPETVAAFVTALVRGIEAEGAIATVKHFPGHGDTQTDSHRSLPVLDVSRERLERVELVPFRAAIAAGVDSVMIAHLSVPAVDPTPAPVRADRPAHESSEAAGDDELARGASLPASLSPRIVDGLLREELGFDGLVVTDALSMGGIVHHFGPGEAAVRAIEAGADHLVKPPDIDAALAAVRAAVASGRLTEERIDESVQRILAAKRRVPRFTFDPARVMATFDAPEHRALAEEVARKAITLLREEPGVLPLRRGARVVELVVSDFPEASAPLPHFGGALGADARFHLDRRSTPADAEPAVRAAADADVVVLSLLVRTRSGAGRTAVPEVARDAIGRILESGARVVAISFGNPYVIRELPELPTYLVTYGPQPVMQAAAARALFGEAPITGRLPVSVPGMFEIGSGIAR